MQNLYLEQSLNFASYIQDKVSKTAGRTDRGVKQAGFLVLWKTTMPSVLVELGYITNLHEEAFLLTEDGQKKLAAAIYDAFLTYKGIYEKQNQYVQIETPAIQKTQNPDSIIFKIQISTSSKQTPLNADFFKPCKSITGFTAVEENYVNNLYKYTVFCKPTYKEIVDVCKEVKQFYPNAFIVAVKNGKFIALGEALKQSSTNY